VVDGVAMEETLPRKRARHYPVQDQRWLQQRGRSWYAVMEVPRSLRAKLGKRRLIKSLGTRDRHVALARRHAALAEFQRIFNGARAIARAVSGLAESGFPGEAE
jgi:hypothetical protein